MHALCEGFPTPDLDGVAASDRSRGLRRCPLTSFHSAGRLRTYSGRHNAAYVYSTETYTTSCLRPPAHQPRAGPHGRGCSSACIDWADACRRRDEDCAAAERCKPADRAAAAGCQTGQRAGACSSASLSCTRGRLAGRTGSRARGRADGRPSTGPERGGAWQKKGKGQHRACLPGLVGTVGRPTTPPTSAAVFPGSQQRVRW